jgi:hypothetical protein
MAAVLQQSQAVLSIVIGASKEEPPSNEHKSFTSE